MILLQINQFQTTAELAPFRDRLTLLAQRPFQIGLIEGHQLRMAVDAASGIGGRTAQAAEGACALLGDGDEGSNASSSSPDHLQDAQGFVIQGDGRGSSRTSLTRSITSVLTP